MTPTIVICFPRGKIGFCLEGITSSASVYFCIELFSFCKFGILLYDYTVSMH